MKNFNRLKAVHADSAKTNKWLGEQFGKDPVIISKWCIIPHNQICSLCLKFQTYCILAYENIIVNRND